MEEDVRVLRLIVLLVAVTTPTHASAQTETSTPPPTARLLADGPHVFHKSDGSVVARWVVDGEVQQKQFAAKEPIELPRFAEFLGGSLQLTTHEIEPPIWPQPQKLVVISDVEGEYDAMLRFLRAHDVVDENGSWKFGENHMVCIGDMLDRGSKVTETLWHLLRLAKEAKAAGGHLHYVLGNHEVMMMGGDVRYTVQKYKDVAALLGIPTEGLLGADTELGRWFRTRNTVVRIGGYLFVHGGISPPVATDKVDLVLLNDVMRSVLGVPPATIQDPNLGMLTWGRPGPLWYRGYFAEYSYDFGPRPSEEVIDSILENLGARTIVIGHTKVSEVTSVYPNRRVLAIDIPWATSETAGGILIEGEEIHVLDLQGGRRELK